MGEIEIFINFLNWILPALGVIAFMVGLPVFIIWYLISGRKRHSGMWMAKRAVLAFVAFIGIFIIYGVIQLIGALFGIDTNRTANSEQGQSKTQ